MYAIDSGRKNNTSSQIGGRYYRSSVDGEVVQEVGRMQLQEVR